ncbi:MAG: Ldh family oxidoreductase [Gammaproteobacteria bacterium]|nr:Ldh family oxidoreductase [Gammaproteobacteria bacterium]NIM72356.1 Ldh family oxidoreductase [Gammaproteobacteria bacterium]NIN40192.1 Ldh family oxidoreductase [Gammaproteobacteria bacterium]NIO24114.1 Ldh family oxidoreductase [Gammaproteobacteria bacterium]NIO65602.1 Ldh family oxidoreductase [Gammaproteobacteria bacterium]
MGRISLDAIEELACAALVAANTSQANARSVAAALVAADADGLASHGVSRVPFYADQAASGKVNGHAVPRLEQPAAAALRVDAADGFAYPAIRVGLERAVGVAADAGVAALSIANSHHCGACGYHVEQVAARGLVALGFSNTPAGIAPWGGSRGSFGTNPIGFACPRHAQPPLVVDLSLSAVARGKVMLAEKRGEAIPEGWALDAEGRPTTDPRAALSGTMVPIGGAKGAALAMMVELLTAALAGSNFAFEASSFFSAEGPPPRVAQTFLVMSPQAFGASAFLDRVEALVADVHSQAGARLPGDRRYAKRADARARGVEIGDDLLAELRRRAGA